MSAPQHSQTESGASTSLTSPEGREWLEGSISAPALPLELEPSIELASRIFGCSQMAASFALIQSAAHAVGPAVLISDPFGRDYPVCLQTLSSCPPGSGYGQWLSTLSGVVTKIFAVEFGRGSYRGSALAEAGFASAAEDGNAIVENARWEHQNALFPLGEIITDGVVAALVKEAKEVSFASISDGHALESYLHPRLNKRTRIRQFINAGWSGRAIPGKDGHPVYPAVCLDWLATPCDVASAVKRGLLEQLPGLLVAAPQAIDGEVAAQGGATAELLCKQWEEFVTHIVNCFRLPMTLRHVIPQMIPRFQFSEKVGLSLFKTSAFTPFAPPTSAAASLFAKAPQQIAKIAAILTLFKGSLAIGNAEVDSATRVFRWLAKGTIAALESCDSTNGGECLSPAQIMASKLGMHGPLSPRDLARKYHHQKMEIVRSDACLALAEGLIEFHDGKYRAKESAGGAELPICQHVSASAEQKSANLGVFPPAA